MRWLIVLVAASACGGPVPVDAPIGDDAGPGAWRAVAGAAGAAILRPSATDGCLVETGERLAPEQERPLLSAGAHHLLIDEDGSVVRRDEASELDRPEAPGPARAAVVERETPRSVYDEGGCPVPDGGPPLPEGRCSRSPAATTRATAASW